MVKIFMKDPWKETTFPPIKLRGFVDLLRPFTLLAPLVGGLCGAILGAKSEDFRNFDLLQLIYGVGTLVIINAASNALNQVTDLEIDRINKPYRPIPSKIVSVNEALSVAALLYAFALFRAFLLNSIFFGFVSIIIGVTMGYSLPPLRFKKRLLLSNVSIAMGRGLLGFVAAWTIFGYVWDPFPWILGSIMFVYLLGTATTKDFTDIAGDKKYGIKTLPTIYGTKKSALFTIPFFILPFLLIPLIAFGGYLKLESVYLAIILILWGAYTSILMVKYVTTSDKKFENTPAWKNMYLMLLTFQVGFCLIYLF
jgi:4-hydroxybenzoate polyprenyltransferase